MISRFYASIRISFVAVVITFICSQLIILPFLFSEETVHPHSSGSVFWATGGASSNDPDQPPSKLQINHPGDPDGMFNGVPLYLKNGENISSQLHCVGDNFRPDSWKHRSCRYEFICFNTLSRDFVMFQSAEDATLSELLSKRETVKSSDVITGVNQTVSIGGINQKWGGKKDQGIGRLSWEPKKIPAPSKLRYYELPDQFVMTPFHSLNGENPGHLVWDDFLPIYTLLEMFGLLDHHPLMLRYTLQDRERGLWASCDFRDEKRNGCNHMMKKFGPLMWGPGSPSQITSNVEADFSGSDPTVRLVCAKHGVAGIGELTDHGISKSHGWEEGDYRTTHNHGRGSNIYRFRNYMMRNMGFLSTSSTISRRKPHRVLFSLRSSERPNRNLDFELQMQQIRDAVPSASVEGVVFREMTLEKQLEVASTASVLITVCGGSAVTGMFLPKGSSLIVYYAEDGGIQDNRPTYLSAMLDWDLLNSMTHLRVHWMPRNTRKEEIDGKALVSLVKHELELIDKGSFS